MVKIAPAVVTVLDALDEPALLIQGRLVVFANVAAKALLGSEIEGSDVRLAIRHPRALEFILSSESGDIEFTGIGAVERPWLLSARSVEETIRLIRLTDRTAAQAAEKMRVDFVANASHELRTPLTAILGYGESLEDGDVQPELAAQFAGTIRSEAKRMLAIIEDLMSLSRIEADRFVAPASQVAVGSVVSSALDAVRILARKRKGDFHTDIQNDLPLIPGDFPQLVQLIDNLLSNALRYGCASGGGSIRLTARADGAWVAITIADDGPGIAREHLPFITRRFYRVDSARSRESGGTGLGLAIVKHIVERHRGTLAIDSAVGAGTTVEVRLPLA